MTSGLYQKYTNIRIMLGKYRRYTVLDHELSLSEFGTLIQLDDYVQIKSHDEKGHMVYTFLIRKDSAYAKHTSDFTKLLKTIKSTPCDIIFVTSVPFSTYINKVIDKQPETMNIYNYAHKHFNMEITKTPFCTPHYILTPSEVIQVIRDLKANPLTLPKIYTDDVQAIWIGAKIGHMIKTISESALVGKSVVYRVVSYRGSKGEDEKKEEI